MALVVCAAEAQNVITTVAGIDSVFTGNGRAAASVPIGYVNGVTSDSAGNVYFTDPLEHLVLRVSNTGILTVVAGNGVAGYSGDGGPATKAAIAASDNPEQYVPLVFAEVALGGIALDQQGDVFFGDGHYVRMVTPAGIISTVAGGGTSMSNSPEPATTASLGTVTGMVFDTAGNLYFCEGNRIRKLSPGGTISTYAGTGASGYAGDMQQATAAQLSLPMGLAFDAQGNLYVADGNTLLAGIDARIRRITPQGIITTVAGGGTANVANGALPLQLNLPQIGSVAVDSSGNLYAFGAANGTLIKLTATGNVFTNTTLITSPVNAPFTSNVAAASAYVVGQRLFDNSGLAFDGQGNLYVADSAGGYLCKINPAGLLTVVAGNGQYSFAGDTGPATTALIQGPTSMAQGPDGTIYFVDSLNFRVRAISPSGIINTILSSSNYAAIGLLESLRAVATDPSGNLYALLAHRLLQLSPTGTLTIIVNPNGTIGDKGDGGPAIDAELENALSLTRDSQGNLYIADAGACRIRKVTPALIINSIAGTGTCAFTPDGTAALNHPLATPSSVYADSLGGIYFQESPVLGLGNDIIRYITPQGILKTIVGTGHGGFSGDGGPATQAQIVIFERTGMQLDSAGNFYFADGYNNRVRVISAQGIINTFAGNGTAANAGDGDLAKDASLIVPQGLLLDASGNLYISDIAGNRIREVLSAPPAISITPATFSFTAKSGGAITPPQQLDLTGPVSGVGFTLAPDFTVNWITSDVTSGSTPQIVNLRVDPTSLAPGQYQGLVLIESPLANPPASEVKVTVNVGAAEDPSLSIDKPGLSFTYPRNPTVIETKNVVVSNSGSGSLAFAASAQTISGGGWLQISPASGTVTPNTPEMVYVTANPTGLAVGTYRGAVTITSSTTGQTSTVLVTLTVSSLDTAIALSHSGLSFTAVEGGGVIPPGQFTVNNIGRGTMDFNVSTNTLSGGAWLSATPPSGSITAGGAPPPVTVSVNPAGLAAGFYYGTVRIDAPGAANTPHVVAVGLRVLESGSDPGPAITPSEMVIKAVQGAPPPGGLDVYIYNVSATPLSFVSGVAATSSSDNFYVLPQSATLDPAEPTHMVVQPLSSNLAPGVYTATITLQFSDGKIRVVGLRTIVTAAPPAPTSTTPANDARPRTTAGCTPTQLVPVITVLGQSFNVPAAWPVALETTVNDDCGNTVNSGTVGVSFSNGDPPLSLVPDGQNGLWNATWVSGNTSGPVTLTITATDSTGSLTGKRTVTGGLGDMAPAPVLDVAVSSASFAQNVPLSPLSIISVAGQNLSNGSASAQVIPLGTTLADATLVMAGYPLPLYYASSTLINAVSPAELTVNTSHQIIAQQGNTLSVPILVDVAPAEPAVFLFPGPGDPATQGAIVNGLNYTVAQVGTPVTAGDLLAIYCTGLGVVNANVPDGSGAPGSPLASTVATPTVTVGGQPTNIIFSGLAPGTVGLYQINVLVPPGIAPSDSVPVVVSIDGQVGPTVTISVH